MSSPWIFVLLLIFVLFLIIMAVRSVRDFYIWYRDGREFAREQKPRNCGNSGNWKSSRCPL